MGPIQAPERTNCAKVGRDIDADSIADENAQFITVDELRQRSGLSIATIHRLKRAGKILCYQPSGKGGRLLFPLDAIERSAATNASSVAPADKVVLPQRLSGPTPGWRKRG